MDTPTSPAEPIGSGLKRLALASAQLLVHQQLTARCAELVQALESGGLAAVAGDRCLVEEMQRCLGDAQQRLAALGQDGEATTLVALEDCVDDVVWTVAATRLPELLARVDDQQQQVGGAKLVLEESENQLNAVQQELDEARIAGTLSSAIEAELFAARSRFAALRTALQGRLYAELVLLSQPLEGALVELQRHVQLARPQMERMKPLLKQADLMIMRSPQPSGDFDYRVVLRCADRSQTRGIHIIEDSRVLSQTDHGWLIGQLATLTMNAYRHLGGPMDPVSGQPDLHHQLIQVGAFLKRLVIPDSMVDFLTGQTWSFNIVTNDLELPWELLCFSDEIDASVTVPNDKVFCLGQAISRLPLGKSFPRGGTPQRPHAGRRRRMLLIHADLYGTLPAAADEVEALVEALKLPLDVVRLRPKEATVRRLNELLTDSSFDLIHYAGHAIFDRKDASKSALVLADGLFPAHKVLLLNRGKSLVFLNACDSAASPAQPAGVGAPDMPMGDLAAVAGLASAFLYSGALGCVGSLWPVGDRSAANLAVAFYDRLLDGEPVGEALRLARVACRNADPDGSTWAGYVLYGDPTLRLTEV